MTIIEAAAAVLKSGEIGVHRREDQRAAPVGATAGLRPELPDRPAGKQAPAGRVNSAANSAERPYSGPERRIAQRRRTRRNILLDTRTSDRRTGTV